MDERDVLGCVPLSRVETPAQGRLVVRNGGFNAVKVFSATMFADRGQLGEKVTSWIAEHPSAKISEFVVTQSSDASFHCVVITVFYWEAGR